LGYSIIGGLLVSTLLTLYLVPAVYVTFEGLRRKRTPTPIVGVPDDFSGVRAPISYEPVADRAASTGRTT
jgi:hypothetical protein